MKYLKIYGLQRSGTNYLKWLLEQNFDVFVLQNFLGLKHGRVEFLRDNEEIHLDLRFCTLTPEQKKEIRQIEVPRIAIRKNLYAWMVSFYKYQRFNWNKNYKKIINAWIEADRHYQQYCTVYNYIDLLTKPVSMLMFSESVFELKRRNKNFILSCDRTMPRGGDDHSDSWSTKYDNKPFGADYYINKLYMKEIPILDKINEYLIEIQADDFKEI